MGFCVDHHLVLQVSRATSAAGGLGKGRATDRYGDRCNPSWFGNTNHSHRLLLLIFWFGIVSGASVASLVQKLWHLGGFPRASFATDNGDQVVPDRINDCVFLLEDRQLQPRQLNVCGPVDHHKRGGRTGGAFHPPPLRLCPFATPNPPWNHLHHHHRCRFSRWLLVLVLVFG
jgi:hypothetical protein